MRSHLIPLGFIAMLSCLATHAQAPLTHGDVASSLALEFIQAEPRKAASEPRTKEAMKRRSNANAPCTCAPGEVRGIDESGTAFVETTDADGTKRRRTRTGVVITSPNGQRRVLSFANAPYPTPPALPGAGAAARAWFDQHNAALLGLISATVNGNQQAMDDFLKGEAASTGGDPLQQIYFRTDTLSLLLGPKQ